MGREIYRDTDHNNEAEYHADEISADLDRVNSSKLLTAGGKLKDKYYSKLSGYFYFINRQGEDKMAYVEYRMNNALTEWVIGKVLLNEDDNNFIDVENAHFAPFLLLSNLVSAQVPFIDSLSQVYLETVKFLNARTLRKNGKVQKVINPNSGKVIKVNKPAYKKLFGDIRPKKVDYKSLSTYEQIMYDIVDNCLVDLFTKYEEFEMEELEEILEREINNDISVLECIKIYEHKGFSIRMYDATHNIYHQTNEEAERIFKIYGDHIYLLSTDKTKQKKTRRVIDDISDIDKYKNNKLIVTDEKLMEEIKEKIQKDMIMIEYTEYETPYKSNIIVFNPYYEIDKNLLKDNDSKCRSVYRMINNELELTGYMNLESRQFFNRSCKIRFMRSDQQHELLIDSNKAYPSKLMINGLVFPVPTFNNYWKPYNKDYYGVNGFYYCELTSYDDKLGTCDDIYSYYAVEELKKDKRIKKITHMFICSKISTMNPDKINFVKKVGTDRIRAYIGWLLSRQSVDIKKYNLDNNSVDVEALQNYYGEELSINKKYMSINKVYMKLETGILANMMIKELSNIELYKMDKEIKKLNPNIQLVSIRTDSLGYFNNGEEIKKPEHLFKSDPGFWKIENKDKKIVPGNYKLVKQVSPPDIKDIKINEYIEQELSTILEKDESFIIAGKYGTGKTYSISGSIIPHMKTNNKTYVLASYTKENSERIKGVTLASIFNNKSIYEIKSYFKNIDYLIIDEAPIICEDMLCYLDYVKTNLNTKMILIGDENQTKSKTFRAKWNDCPFFLKLADMNKITLTTNHRCDEKTLELLQNLEKLSPIQSLKYIRSNCKLATNNNECKYHLCRYTKTKQELDKLDNSKCSTIICNQGSTINEPYMIHDIGALPKGQLVTAISRSSSYDNIYFKL